MDFMDDGSDGEYNRGSILMNRFPGEEKRICDEMNLQKMDACLRKPCEFSKSMYSVHLS